MGLIAGMSGTLFGTVASNPWTRFAIGNLLLIFALAMLDVIPVSAPQRFVQWAGGTGGGSYPAVFVLGATSGIVAAPCGAPAFARVLTFVATTHSALLGFIYLFVFSLGMTALLTVVGIFSGTISMLPARRRLDDLGETNRCRDLVGDGGVLLHTNGNGAVKHEIMNRETDEIHEITKLRYEITKLRNE
jgi:cytochrome c biogenesis protein CcdA